MPFNIQAFKENVNSYGYLDNNNFEVWVQTPPILFNSSVTSGNHSSDATQIAKRMKLRIDQVRVPGINLQTAQIQRYGIGPVQNMPISAQFQDAQFSVLVDHYAEIWQYWYNWTNLIFNYNGVDSVNGPTVNSFPNYQAEYKQNYSTSIMIVNYDHFGNDIQRLTLFEAFPSSIREIPLSWGDSNLMKLNISISYTSYSITGSTVTPYSAPPPPTPIKSIRSGVSLSAR
jgi:hypothetical protein